MTEQPTSDPTSTVARALRDDYTARYAGSRTELIEAGRVRDYLLALDDLGDWSEERAVPSLFLLTLGRTRRPQPSKGTAVKGGDAYEFSAPVHVGDRITVERTVREVEIRQRPQGPLYVVPLETTYVNQSGVEVARSSETMLRWGV